LAKVPWAKRERMREKRERMTSIAAWATLVACGTVAEERTVYYIIRTLDNIYEISVRKPLVSPHVHSLLHEVWYSICESLSSL